MKNKSKSKILLVIILAASITLGAVGTAAWFTYNQYVEALNSKVKLQVYTGGLEISVDRGATWGDTINGTNRLTYAVDTDVLADPAQGGQQQDVLTYMIDITGNGKDFLYPVTLDANDKPITTNLNSFVTIDETNYNGYMVWFDLWFRTSAAMDVYLAEGSEVKESEIVVAMNYVRESLYDTAETKFSRDGISGAARVSFVDMTGVEEQQAEPELKYVWAPNDNYELRYLDNARTQATFLPRPVINNVTPPTPKKESSISPLTNPETAYGYWYRDTDGTYKHYNYTADDYAYGRFVTTTTTRDTYGNLSATPNGVLARIDNNGIPQINHTNALCSFEQSEVRQVKKLRVFIWIEGTDREADKALNAGEMLYKLVFVGINKQEAEKIWDGTDETALTEVPDGNYLFRVTHVADAGYSGPNYRRYVIEYKINGSADDWAPVDSTVTDLWTKLQITKDGHTWTNYSLTAQDVTDPDDSSHVLSTYYYGFSAATTIENVYLQIKENSTTKPSNVIKVSVPEPVDPNAQPPEPDPGSGNGG